jgi:hypothetical protein
MKTPSLLEVERQPTKLELFKAKHDIYTHHSGSLKPAWCALHMPTARTFGYGVTDKSDFYDCVSKICRLLDESGVMGYGDTERGAIVATCKACGIEVKPNDL